MSKPCCIEQDHVPIDYGESGLQDNWRFYTTPPAVDRQGEPQHRPAAVVIDCEMGTSEIGESELIRVSVVDYFSGAVLLDSLVFPDVKMAHYNTRFSGVSRQAMNEARARRTCLFGRKEARRAVWRVVGPETIVVGHAANSDLTSLRWIHHTIADTLFIEQSIADAEKLLAEAEAQQKAEEAAAVAAAAIEGEEDENKEAVEETVKVEQYIPRGLSLKALAHERLNRTIQIRGQGHDSVEDALATRDLMHWHVVNGLATADAS